MKSKRYLPILRDKKPLIWLILGGLTAYPIEGLWRIPSNGGWVSVFMLPVYGLCFLAVGSINQVPRFYNLSMRLQAVIGTVTVLVVELFFGVILNIGLGLGIWDYSGMPFNILGQICLPYGIAWFLLMPFAVCLSIYSGRFACRTALRGFCSCRLRYGWKTGST